MRVIAGSAKGTRLAPVPAGTRPLSDRAREGLFSSLGDRVPGARCADLYAGTGALGIEALSRGASWCDFVDDGAAAVRTIEENLGRAKVGDRAAVHRADCRRFLQGRPPPARWDLAFLDPPHALGGDELAPVLHALAGRLAPGAAFALTRASRNPTVVVPVHYALGKRLVYGDTLVLVFLEEE